MSKITDKIAQLPDGASFFSLEFFPPKTQAGTANLLPRLQRLAAFRPLFVTVTWGAGGSTATKSLDLAEICASNLGLDVCLHLTCTNSSQAVVDEALTRCKELGIRNILALRGDEPRPKEYADPVVESVSGATRRAGGQPGEGVAENMAPAAAEPEVQFEWAEDLVRYIRQNHGDWFCIGVAGYPEGWTASPYDPDRSVERDLPWLVRKVQAGADFIMSQLFFDIEAYLSYEKKLRAEPSGALKEIAIVPGLMPVQSWGILARTTKLTGAHVPKSVLERFERVKKDDEEVKQVGVDVLSDMVAQIQREHAAETATQKRPPQGYHFYTLNLEKSVAQILHRCDLIPKAADDEDDDLALEDGPALNALAPDGSHEKVAQARRRKSSATQNHVIVTRPSISVEEAKFQEDEKEAARVRKDTRANALAIAEGEGALGREATWDDYPNGRWGDARSPAYGSIDGYGPSLHVSNAEAIALWGRPSERRDISEVFNRYLKGASSAVPWSEEPLSAETKLVETHLLAMNERGWWSVASQPAVDSQRSDDPVVGWGPKIGGWVWQKPFVEFFLPRADWEALRKKLDAFKEAHEEQDGVTYFAGDAFGTFSSSDIESINPVTWGSFKGKEIITPTIIEAESFRAWQDEAFGIWREWQRVYPAGSPSSRLIEGVWRDLVLVNVIGHHYKDGGTLWDLLLGRL